MNACDYIGKSLAKRLVGHFQVTMFCLIFFGLLGFGITIIFQTTIEKQLHGMMYTIINYDKMFHHNATKV